MEMKNKNKVKVIPLGGLGEIGKNITAIEYDNEIIVIDERINEIVSLYKLNHPGLFDNSLKNFKIGFIQENVNNNNLYRLLD